MSTDPTKQTTDLAVGKVYVPGADAHHCEKPKIVCRIGSEWVWVKTPGTAASPMRWARSVFLKRYVPAPESAL